MECIEDEWNNFISNSEVADVKPNSEKSSQVVPECEELYISTKTKVLFLNQSIDINNIFWKIPIIKYWEQKEGVIKKQMKIVTKCQEELDEIQKKLLDEYYYTENIIKKIDNPDARRIKFKDERKITIGISKKDILNSRGKVKNAFYNCFALIVRFYYNDEFREIHIKVFNTGKLEIPGILNTDILIIVKKMILDILLREIPNVDFIENNSHNNVLINSNFNCGFYINRDRLHLILKNDYGIDTSYDPCSYPGIKCKFYFNNAIKFDKYYQLGKIDENDCNMKMSELIESKKYTEVSFMIFRTGSCLIIGNCDEDILYFIYDFIKNIFYNQYHKIQVKNEASNIKVKQVKCKKKVIIVTN